MPISDIRPDNQIESEIFPPELTREAQNKDVFTPPNHQQMRFLNQEQQNRKFKHPLNENDQGFFITDVHQDPNAAIEEQVDNESERDQLASQEVRVN